MITSKAKFLFNGLLAVLLFGTFQAEAQYFNPVSPVNPVNGIEYYYYESNQTTEPFGLDTLQSFLKSGAQPAFGITNRLRNDNFTFNFRGYVKVPVDTVYTFFTSSDDGSNLYIDTTKVVSNDGDHGETERSGTVRLKAGYHKIRVYFHESGSGEILKVSYSSDLIAKTIIPDSVLFRNGIPFPEVTGLKDTSMFEQDSLTLAFKVKLPNGNSSSLQVNAFSSNSASLPLSGISASGTDSLRTIKLKTLTGVTGIITVFVRSASSQSNTGVQSFKLNVRSRNPLLSLLADTFIVVNNAISNRQILLSDPDNATSTLILTATSSNESVIPTASIVITGTGDNRFLSATPANNATGNVIITYRVTDPTNRAAEKSFRVDVGDTSTFRAPDPVLAPVQGLHYVLARADGGSVLNFNTVLPDKVGTISNFSLTPAEPNMDYFGIEYRGFVRVPKTAAYTFYTNSDDGSVLFIGNTQVVDNDGGHGTQERSGNVNLKAGTHKMVVKYKEGNGGNTLEVRYSGGGIPKKLIPNAELFRSNFIYPTITATSDTIIAYKTWIQNIPFTVSDTDGVVSNVTAKTFSYNETVVAQNGMSTSGTGADRIFGFNPIAHGVVRLKLVVTDEQGLNAIQFFNVRVKDTSVISSVLTPLSEKESRVYPNPTQGKFSISGISETETVRLFDLRGIQLYRGPISGADLKDYRSGMYFLKMESKPGVFRIEKE